MSLFKEFLVQLQIFLEINFLSRQGARSIKATQELLRGMVIRSQSDRARYSQEQHTRLQEEEKQ